MPISWLNRPIAAFAWIGLLLAAAPARAAEPITLFGYGFSITVQGATASAYQGSKHYSGFPSVSVAVVRPWDYDAFGAPDDSPSASILNFKNVQAGPVISFITDRGDSHALAGMKKIGAAGEAGGFVNYWPTPWLRLRTEALRGVFSEEGILVNTAADLVGHKGRWTLSTGPRFAWADDRYNQTYFGVTPTEASTSRNFRQPFTPTGGPMTTGVEASAEYKWFDRWRLDFSGNYDRLLDDDARSPITRRGSANQYSVAAGVRFMLSRP